LKEPEGPKNSREGDRSQRLSRAIGLITAMGTIVIIALAFGGVFRDPLTGRDGSDLDAAEAANANAELELAIRYAKGDGVTLDYGIAIKWFRVAAEHGQPRAQYDLGVMYERGRGVPVDLGEAFKWYLKSARANYPSAQYNVAVYYTKGQQVAQDLPEAAFWYRRAASQGVVEAMTYLGMMYDKGDGIAASQFDAYAWYLAAAKRGSSLSSARAIEIFASFGPIDKAHAEVFANNIASTIQDHPEVETARLSGR
jgi:TPR repeat protein